MQRSLKRRQAASMGHPGAGNRGWHQREEPELKRKRKEPSGFGEADGGGRREGSGGLRSPEVLLRFCL